MSDKPGEKPDVVPDKAAETGETSKETFAIRLLACFFIFTGVDAIGKMIYGLFNASFTVDLTFLVIFVGKGLLERRQSSRGWAVFIVWLWILALPVIMVLGIVYGPFGPVAVFTIPTNWSMPWYVTVPLMACAIAFFMWQRYVLTRPHIIATFTPKGRSDDNWWRVIAVAAALISVANYSAQHLVVRTIRDLDHHRATIYAVDGETGEPLQTSVRSTHTWPKAVLPRVYYAYTSSPDRKTIVDVNWTAAGPVKVSVGAKGYEYQDVMLGPDDDGDDVTVRLVREEPPDEKD